MRYLLLTVLLLSPELQALAEPVTDADRGAFEELQRIAAQRPAYSREVGERVTKLIMSLWTHPVYRHPVATVMNLNGGHVDRIFNRSTLEAESDPLPNFAEVDGRLLRGGQPSRAGFEQLREQGVRTIVNLRYEEPDEKPIVESLGMRYVYLPIPDTETPTPGQIDEWLRLAAEKDGGKVYVHCAWGVNRTGTMVALWRIQHGMRPEKALEEACKYGFDEGRLKADKAAELIRGFRRR